MTGQAAPPLIEVSKVSKHFPGVRALNDVDLTLSSGEVLAVIGENGAGKSTLMKILAGVQHPDRGEIRVNGKTVVLNSVETALNLGIALIHQELNLADNLNVGANIFLGREPRRMGLIDHGEISNNAGRFLKMVGLKVDPSVQVSELTLGRQQMVEIAKALSINAEILIMDEPTSSLSQRETENLFTVIKDLRNRGVSVVYISHRLGEVQELADRVIVLRDGCNAGELKREEIHHDAMVQLMVGREISQFYQRNPHEASDTVLEVRDLRTPAHPGHPLSFNVRAGEIVGIAGLVGAGRTELLQTLFGVTPAVGGTIHLNQRKLIPQNPREAIKAGIGLVPEDRKKQGLILEMEVGENMSLASLDRDQKRGFLNRLKEREIASEMIGQMRIKTPSNQQVVQFLSGGNQQKVVLGKWLAMKPCLLLLDEPTRGIDVGAKQEIYGLMEELAQHGVAVLFVSSEMEEILGMSDRTLVMHEGRLAGELSREELSEETVMKLATGRDESFMVRKE